MSNAIIKAHVEHTGFFSVEGNRHMDMPIADFGELFRQCAPYIASHRGKTMVIHLPSSLFSSPPQPDSTSASTTKQQSHKNPALESALHDIAILHLLGIKIVLVVGLREQIDTRLHQQKQYPANSESNSIYNNRLRITDELTLHIIQEEVGKARCEVERLFACGFHKALAGKGSVSVVSGNKFFSAKPLGVRHGVDYQHSGEVRKIEREKIEERLQANEIVLLTPLAYAPSGEMYYVPSESLCAEAAIQLSASKLLFLTSNGESVVDKRTNKLIHSLRFSQALSLLQMWGLSDLQQFNHIEDDAGITRNPPQNEEETNGAPLQVATYVRSIAR
jgi:amino-acid N-acetyltransferase